MFPRKWPGVVEKKMPDGPAAPSVMLASPQAGWLQLEPWTSSFKVGDPACSIGIAVKAETNALAGNRDARIRVVAGRSSAERALKVAVKPSSR
jgi:hypothetical protein